MNILPILTVQEVKEWTANSELERLCDTNPNQVEKYIKQLSWMIWTQVDKEQFLENDIYIIADDFKQATINLLDIYYDYEVVNKLVSKGRRISYSERIDDYQITEAFSESVSWLSWFWLPISNEIYWIFLRYMPKSWFINVNIH